MMEGEDALYFAYGSNLSTRQMGERCPDARPVSVAVLSGHRLAFTRYSSAWGGGVADAVADDGGEVWGLLYEISAADLAALDRYEGGYERVPAVVEAADGSHPRPWLYQVAERSAFTPPTTEYLSVILKAAERLGFPAGYRRLLESVRTAPA